MRRLCGEAAFIAAWLLQVDGLLSDLWPGRVHIGMTAGVHVHPFIDAQVATVPRAEGGGNLSFSIGCPDVSVNPRHN